MGIHFGGLLVKVSFPDIVEEAESASREIKAPGRRLALRRQLQFVPSLHSLLEQI